jgi:glutamyl-tRNA synthetase
MDRMGEQGIAMLAKASQERSKTLDDMFRGNRFFVLADDALTWERSKNTDKAMLGEAPSGCDHLRALLPVLGGVTEWTSTGIEAAVKPYAEAHAAGQLGKAAQPLRIAVSGGTVSPPIFDTLAILGKASTLRRIERAIAAFTATSA